MYCLTFSTLRLSTLRGEWAKELDGLELSLRMMSKDNEIELKALRDIINHLRTDNNTGEMKRIEDDIDEYLIKRVNNIQL